MVQETIIVHMKGDVSNFESSMITVKNRLLGMKHSLTSMQDMTTENKNALQNMFTGIIPETAKFRNVFSMTLADWIQFNKSGQKFQNKGAIIANKIRMLTHGLRGFRMELLGVMFFGMGMKNFFSGLLKPSLEMVGVFDLLKTSMQLLFLPIALQILPYAIKFLNWVKELSPETKLLIGKFVLLGIALGAGLFLFGTMALGIGAIIIAFSGLFNIIDKLIPDFEFAGMQITGFVEAGLGVSLISKAFNFLKGIINGVLEKLFEFDFIRDSFEKLGIVIDDTKTPIENFKALISAALKQVKKDLNLNETFNGINSGFGNVGKVITDNIDIMMPKIDSLVSSLETIAGAIEKIGRVWNSLPGVATGALMGFITGGPVGAVAGGIAGGMMYDQVNQVNGKSGGSTTVINQTNNVGVVDKPQIVKIVDDIVSGVSTNVNRGYSTGLKTSGGGYSIL